MKILYPLKSQNDYIELKYSLRSVEKFFDNPGEILIVGDTLPDWITNITHIELKDLPNQAVFSVRRKVIAAFAYTKEDLFFMNDDFYLLKKADKNFPYYSSGTLDKKGESGARPLLEQLQGPNKYFGHYPAIYKKDFPEIISRFTKECITKSAYLNAIGVETVEIKDCKIVTPMKEAAIMEFIKDLPCFSSGNNSLKSCLPVLEKLFPNPSKYEL
jgi:hypothetical protein